jgi:hypothetical protein
MNPAVSAYAGGMVSSSPEQYFKFSGRADLKGHSQCRNIDT